MTASVIRGGKRLIVVASILAGLGAWVGPPKGYADTFQTLYGTALSGTVGGELVQINVDLTNLAGSSSSVLFSGGAGSDFDSLVLNNSTNPTDIYYDDFNKGTINHYNIPTNTNSVLGTVTGGSGAGPADIAVDPSGTSILVSEFNTGRIDRVTIPGGVSTQVVAPGVPVLNSVNGPEGLAFVPSVSTTSFFADVGPRGTPSSPGTKDIVEYNSSGAVVTTFTNGGAGYQNLDAMVYDPGSGLLWATSHFGKGIYSINPTTGATTFYPVTGFPLLDGAGSVSGSVDSLDGITVANGYIFVVEQDVGPVNGSGEPTYADEATNRVDVFNIATSTWSTNSTSLNVPALDDLAPFNTATITTGVPEPLSAGLALMGVSGLGLAALRRRRAC
jgi:hypothetical protein